MAHEVRHEEADEAATDHENDRRPGVERNSVDEVLCKTRLLQTETKSKTTSHEPKNVPAHFVEVLLSNHARQSKHSHRDHSNHVVVEAMNILTGHPQKYAHSKGNVNDDSARTLVKTFSTFDIEVHFLHLDRIELEEQEPCKNHQNNHIRNTEFHPLAKRNVKSAGLESAKGDGVRRRTNRSTHTTDVCTERNGESKSSLTAVVSIKELEHRAEDSEHHSSSSGVAHEHGEHSGNNHEAKEHPLRILTKRLEEHAGKVLVHVVLASGRGKEEATQEEHDDRVGKRCHDVLELERFNTFHAERDKSRVRKRKDHQHDDEHGGGPDWERLENPEKGSHHKDCDDANFESVQRVVTNEAEGFVRDEEGSDGEHRCNDEFDEFSFCHNERKFSN